MTDEEVKEKVIKIETELPYFKQELHDIWDVISPIQRDHEELKTEIIRYLGRLDALDKDTSTVKKTVEGHATKITEFDEQYRFLANARKNINTIFVAIIIQTIFLISGLLAFVFTLTQKNNEAGGNQSSVVFKHKPPNQNQQNQSSATANTSSPQQNGGGN